MYKMFVQLMALGTMLTSSFGYGAFYVNGDVKVNGLQWDNVTYGKGSSMVPSKWGVPPPLQSVVSWSAGSLPAASTNAITLRGGLNGESTGSIPISITGVQYNTTGISFIEEGNGFGGGCTTDDVLLPLISVEGVSCISNTKLSSPVPTSPFILFRPMFTIDEADIINALNGKAEGNYSASVPITIRYYYENTSGVTTFRNISDVIIFSFNYEPVEVTDLVVIEGDGVMEPIYDTTNLRISARADYKLEAQGYFSNGIVLTMPNQDYELVNNTSPGVTIPYNIVCAECSSTQLVSDGVLVEKTTYIGEGSGVQTNMPFNLSFDYDVEGELLESGTYNDTVTIMVSPRI